MRVIAGSARRLLLKSVPGRGTRPTVDRIKETLFNILNPLIPGSAFLDLFAGSGGIGIEALSRGADLAVFIDNDPKAVSCIRENLEHTRFTDKSTVIQRNFQAALNELAIRKMKFDIVYIDPPYDKGYEQEALNMLTGLLNDGALIIIEADKRNGLDFIKDTDYEIVREKEYKTNKHYFIRIREDNS